MSSFKPIKAASAADRTNNPIRQFVARQKLVVPPPNKSAITLALGDPTVFGNLPPPASLEQAMTKTIDARTNNGYTDSRGAPATRAAIAEHYTCDAAPLQPDDVYVCSGCSDALNLAITVLADAGQNVLLPAPGFTLYETICTHRAVEPRFYRLLPERSWEADLAHMRELCDERTAAILINNPSNPCGSVYSAEHLRALLQLAEERHIPIIADEIYANMGFPGSTPFVPIATLTTTVPVLTVGGLAKRYMVPGWRVGWVLVHDRGDVLTDVRRGLFNLSTLILGANTVAQAAVIAALSTTPQQYYDDTLRTLSGNAAILSEALSKVPGLRVVQPQGAMYMMVGLERDFFDQVIGNDDVEFALALQSEENVAVLPGSIFHFPSFVRLVICPPPEMLREAVARIAAFCERHRRK